MKLIIQVPCFNEAETLPQLLDELPKQIEGIDTIEVLVIDDGSTDGTSAKMYFDKEQSRYSGMFHVLKDLLE